MGLREEAWPLKRCRMLINAGSLSLQETQAQLWQEDGGAFNGMEDCQPGST